MSIKPDWASNPIPLLDLTSTGGGSQVARKVEWAEKVTLATQAAVHSGIITKMANKLQKATTSSGMEIRIFSADAEGGVQ